MESQSDRQQLTASIIIPMRNEEAYVSKCLDSVLTQIQGRNDLEVLCVDGASDDRTRQIVLEYAERDSTVKLVDNPKKIVPVGMNKAIAQAKGEVIIRLDCHAEYDSDYITKCLEVLGRTGADNVGGYLRTVPGSDTTVGRAVAAALSSRFGVGGSVFRTGGDEREVDTVPFGCFRKDVFERFGLYDERLVRNQDMELNSRIRAGGGRIIISPEIQLTYYNRPTFGGMASQAFSNGLWNVYTIYLVGSGLRLRHFIPMGFVASVIGLAIGGLLWPPLLALLAAELAVYFGGAFYMGVKAARAKQTSLLLVVAAFVALHVWYGAGSLWAVVTAPLRFGRPGAGGKSP